MANPWRARQRPDSTSDWFQRAPAAVYFLVTAFVLVCCAAGNRSMPADGGIASPWRGVALHPACPRGPHHPRTNRKDNTSKTSPKINPTSKRRSRNLRNGRHVISGIFVGLLASGGVCTSAWAGDSTKPAYAPGTFFAPASSYQLASEVGVTSRTFLQILVPPAPPAGGGAQPRQATRGTAPKLPPYSGYFFETPASIACVYGLVSSPPAGSRLPDGISAPASAHHWG